MILMVSSHIYICFVFINLSMCHTYIYSIGPMPKSVKYQFVQAISEVSGTAKAVFNGHVRVSGF
jgi:hypothetical protein